MIQLNATVVPLSTLPGVGVVNDAPPLLVKVAVTVTAAAGMVNAHGLLALPPLQLAPVMLQPFSAIPLHGVACKLTASPTAWLMLPLGVTLLLGQPLAVTVSVYVSGVKEAVAATLVAGIVNVHGLTVLPPVQVAPVTAQLLKL